MKIFYQKKEKERKKMINTFNKYINEDSHYKQ